MTDEEILKLAEEHLYEADGGYVFDYGKQYILAFARAIESRMNMDKKAPGEQQ